MKKQVVFNPETEEFFIYTDKTDVAKMVGASRNTVMTRLKQKRFRINGFIIGEADDCHSRRGSGNINELKRKT